MNATAPTRTSLRIPLLMALLFFGPLLVATGMYLAGVPGARPSGSVAHGELLTEPRVLPADSFTLAGHPAFSYHGKWTLAYAAPGDCDAACIDVLYQTRQVRQAIGKENGRVQRVWLPARAGLPADQLRQNDPTLIVLPVGHPGRAPLEAALGTATPGSVFLADPLGNVMLRFPAGTPMKDMHKDLNLLLRASRIG